MLHLLAFSPARQDLLHQLRLACAEGDHLVLLGDGIWFARTSEHSALLETLPCVSLHALQADLLAAGLANDATMPGLDYDGLAALTEEHEQVISWYP